MYQESREEDEGKETKKTVASKHGKNKQHTRKNFREETTELIDENFVFGYHAVIEALKEGRGINYLWQRMPEGKNRWVKRSCSRTVCPSQVGAKTKARSNEQSRRPSKCDFSDHPL